MLSKPRAVHLEAVISQMHHVVLVVEAIPARASAQVALLIDVNTEVSRHKGPHSYVKFATIIKQRPFDVLLHDPVSHLSIGVEDVVLDILQMAKDANFASAVE